MSCSPAATRLSALNLLLESQHDLSLSSQYEVVFIHYSEHFSRQDGLHYPRYKILIRLSNGTIRDLIDVHSAL